MEWYAEGAVGHPEVSGQLWLLLEHTAPSFPSSPGLLVMCLSTPLLPCLKALLAGFY